MKTLREYIFWLSDFFKGGVVRKHYVEIEKIHENNAETSNIRNEYLHAILNYATNNVEFYTSLKNYQSLSDFPVINKMLVKDNLEQFVSKSTDEKKVKKVTTSGSTGTPFTVYKDKNKLNRHAAENIYFNEKAGYPLGQRLYYLRVWNKINNKSSLQRIRENLVMADISELSSGAIQKLYGKMQKDRSPKTILGFASALIELNKGITRDCKDLNIKSIIAISEHLPQEVRNELSQKFNCPVVSRYSNMENGFIANQLIDDDIYEINTASYYVEILGLNDDLPVDEGEMGRVVVTDYFNKAMPLIRYDTGDIAICKIKNNIPYLTSIEGRKTDLIYNTKGEPLSVHIVSNTLWEFKELKQYQFIQYEKSSYLLKINYNGVFSREKELELKLKKYLGTDADIKFEYVSEIPVLNSGKRRCIVNEYYK